jgi:hypothetical protein
MAQTGYTPISIYYSATTTNVPTAGNLVAGELAINTADGKLFYKDSAGVVQTIATKNGIAGGSTTQVQYNSSGSLAGSANMTFSGTALTLANDASISGLTVGKGGGSVAFNTALGVGAIGSSNSGAYSVGVGYNSLILNTSGLQNSGIGALTLNTNTTGSYLTAVGTQALTANTTGNYNSAFGTQSLGSNTTGSNNVAIGNSALGFNTTASENTAIGWKAGYSNTTGTIDAFGGEALYSNTTGTNNVAVGTVSLYTNTTGSKNTATNFSLYYNTTGSNNTGYGFQSLFSNTTASNNTAVGYQAGYSLTTGGTNTFIGLQAGQNSTAITTGNNNIFIGAYTGGSSSSVGQAILISSIGGSVDKGTNTGYINPNGGGVYQGNNSSSWSTTSDARLKKNIVDNTTGLSAINAIQVRNFEYRTANEITDLPQNQAIDIQGVQLGAIAQEIQSILPDCVKTESTGVMSVDTTNLTWYLINAVKELNAKIIALENK